MAMNVIYIIRLLSTFETLKMYVGDCDRIKTNANIAFTRKIVGEKKKTNTDIYDLPLYYVKHFPCLKNCELSPVRQIFHMASLRR